MRPTERSTPAHAGFSLIELVIVVAIIGILAAVALPNYNRLKYDAEVSNALQEIRCAQLAFQARDSYPDVLANTEDFLDVVNEDGVCRFPRVPAWPEFDFYWCIRYLPDGSPYITQCLDGVPADDFITGVLLPDLINPDTQLPQLVTFSSRGELQAVDARPSIPTGP